MRSRVRRRALWLAAGLIAACTGGGLAAAATAPKDTAAPAVAVTPANAATPKAATAPAGADGEGQQEEGNAPAAAPSDAADAPAEDATPAAEVFVPSEAISEDIAVPFPVDI